MNITSNIQVYLPCDYSVKYHYIRVTTGTSLKPEAKPTVLRPIQQETPMARLDAFFFTPPLTAKPHEPSDVSAQDTKQQACSDRECRKRKLNFQQAVSELGDDSNGTARGA